MRQERECVLNKVTFAIIKQTGLFYMLAAAVFALGAALWTTSAQAVNGSELLDYNSDGAYSADEAETSQTILFFTLDHNRDLRISYQEFLLIGKISGNPDRLKSSPEDIQDQFELIDVDDDREISLEEFLADGMRRFNAHDWNRDGRITTNEQPLPP